jgi:predicted transcriptional regulator YheO
MKKKITAAADKKAVCQFSLKDKAFLDMMKPVVDGIAVFLGEQCEVLLHSFDNLDRSIFYIANGHVTGRKVGSPITDLGMKILNESTDSQRAVTDCYYSKTTDGKTLRSVTILIRNNSGKPIGMMCVNMNMDLPLTDFLSLLGNPKGQAQMENTENFVTNVDDLIKTALGETISSINNHQKIPNHEKNKIIVNELIKKGIFDIRGAIDIVARELSLSRYTIYNYIREQKYANRKEKV